MKRCYLLILLCITTIMLPRKFGSNRTSSRQNTIFISSDDDENEFQGFSSFEQGVVLGRGEKKGKLSINSLFPFQGNMALNGGTLSLKKDVKIQEPVNIGVGTIEAEDETKPKNIEFPAEKLVFDLPAQGFEKALSLVEQQIVKSKRAVPVGGSVNSVDWSYDDTYVAVSVESDTGVNELQVYSFIDNVLTLTASVDFGSSDATAVRWHPSKYLLASGKTSDDELQIYDFDPATGLSVQSSDNVPANVTALSWDPTGAHLAVGLQNLSAAVRVYDVDSSGNLGSSVLHDFGLLRTVQQNALDFHTLGEFILVGLAADLSNPELFILQFDGSSLSESASREVGQTVFSASWIPNEQIFSIGLNGGTERLRTLRFDEDLGVINEITSALTSETLTVNGLQWDPNGSYVAIGTDVNANGQELEVYFFNRSDNVLNLVSGFEVGTDILSLRWSHDAAYIAVGDVDGMLDIYSFADDIIIFKNIRLSFNSNVRVRSPIRFEGVCVVNGGGNEIDLLSTASIIVANSGELHVENAKVKGIQGTNVSVFDDDGLLVLRDLQWAQDNYYTFTQGALSLNGKISMGGNQIFAYESMSTSTLQSKSTWKLDNGFTFSYDPIMTGTQDPTRIELIDDTSLLKLDNANVYDIRAWKLTKGMLSINRDVRWAGEPILGTIFGSDSGDDLSVFIHPGGKLQLTQGILNNKNQSLSSWSFQAITSRLIVQSNVRFNTFNSIDVSPGFIAFEQNARVGHASGAQILGPTEPQGRFFQFNLGP